MRRTITVVLSASAIITTAWLAFLLSGYGVLIGQMTTTRNLSGSVTCNYFRAKGFYRFTRSVAEPNSFSCPGWVFLRGPESPGERQRRQAWAETFHVDQFTMLECRFFAASQADGDDDLSNRFGPNSPLRLTLAPDIGYVELWDSTDREALGRPVQTIPASVSQGIFLQFDAGALPIFGPAQRGRLTIILSPRDGHAAMFLLRRSDEHLLWSRQGGCRPSA